ncbi:uncharacterized protein LOC110983703 [Acanthaster planci]|uniref:Uncharacterized protein LOC110983703 n=1 Tax=Acanthaster planci TaxID=133434 RepID=A0A8B7Z266_ACAPL|nr:uncharacterized protein LOC110983703 [Acanthaster planci]
MSRPTDLRLNGTSDRETNMPPIPQRRDFSPMASRPFGGECVEALSLDYYYGKIENSQVEELLRPYMDARGTFILRDSNTEPGVITISVVDNPRHIYHFKVNWTSGLYEVTEKLRFRSLGDLVKFFNINDVPSRNTSQLKLLTPISRSSRRSPPNSPPTELRSPTRPPRPPRTISPQASWEQSTADSFINLRGPMPIPKPGTEPIYIDNDHVYCRAEDLKKSKVDEIMELCKLSDQKFKKCTCGLYMEQSILVEDWMMHIDRPTENQTGSGRVFFVNSVSNLTLWELPDRVMFLLSQQQPEKYRFVQKLLQEGGNL